MEIVDQAGIYFFNKFI